MVVVLSLAVGIGANVAVFTAVKTGIAGDKYFEVLDGLKAGDEVITGPFNLVRGLRDGDAVKVTPSAVPSASTTGTVIRP